MPWAFCRRSFTTAAPDQVCAMRARMESGWQRGITTIASPLHWYQVLCVSVPPQYASWHSANEGSRLDGYDPATAIEMTTLPNS
jgi:hypothetical protein